MTVLVCNIAESFNFFGFCLKSTYTVMPIVGIYLLYRLLDKGQMKPSLIYFPNEDDLVGMAWLLGCIQTGRVGVNLKA